GSRVPVSLDVSDLAILDYRHRGARHAGLGQRLRRELINLLPQISRQLRLRGGKACESKNHDNGKAMKQQIRSAHGILLDMTMIGHEPIIEYDSDHKKAVPQAKGSPSAQRDSIKAG